MHPILGHFREFFGSFIGKPATKKGEENSLVSGLVSEETGIRVASNQVKCQGIGFQVWPI